MWLWFFGAVLFVQLVYWGLIAFGFRRAGAAASADEGSQYALPPLSVVIAARNEAERLPHLLEALARQTHPCFEVVVVDDASTDATAEVVRTHAAAHANVRLLHVEDPRPPRKKYALTRGIAAARHDLLALTDADCTPPPGWLAALACRHAASTEDQLLIGYSPQTHRPGIFNRLVRYETFVTGVLTAAAIGLGQPYMAVGRNLSYPRALFERVGGFEATLRSMSGDDDLFVQHVARYEDCAEVHALLGLETFVREEPPADWRAWLRQKRRHASAGRFYDASVQVSLALFQGTSIALWLAPFFLGWTGAGLLAVRLLAQRFALRAPARTLGEEDLMAFHPFLDALYAAYHLFVAPLGLAQLPERW